jgi:glycopeptide antibiotics resistance protein
LLPFDFSIEIFQANLGNIERFKPYGKPFYIAKNFDAIANILFFIPLGIIFYNTRYAFRKKRIILIDLSLATLTGLLLSLSIELTQLLIKERTTSLVDIMMNAFGSFLGALIALIFTNIFNYSNRKKIVSFFRNLPSELYLIPFLFISFLIPENIPVYLLDSEKIENIYFSWDYIIRPTWIWSVLYVTIPISVIISISINKRFKLSQKYYCIFLSFLVSLILLGIIELIKSSGNSGLIPPENIISGVFGVMIGIIIHELLSAKYIRDRSFWKQKSTFILFILFLFLGSLILYKSAYPLNFNFSQDYILKKSAYALLSTYSFIPFSGFMNLFVYTIQNILLFLPIGIILSEMERYSNLKKNIYFLVVPSILLIMISFTVKIVTENQIPLLLEIPIDVLGIFSGYFIWYGFQKSI